MCSESDFSPDEQRLIWRIQRIRDREARIRRRLVYENLTMTVRQVKRLNAELRECHRKEEQAYRLLRKEQEDRDAHD